MVEMHIQIRNFIAFSFEQFQNTSFFCMHLIGWFRFYFKFLVFLSRHFKPTCKSVHNDQIYQYDIENNMKSKSFSTIL